MFRCLTTRRRSQWPDGSSLIGRENARPVIWMLVSAGNSAPHVGCYPFEGGLLMFGGGLAKVAGWQCGRGGEGGGVSQIPLQNKYRRLHEELWHAALSEVLWPSR